MTSELNRIHDNNIMLFLTWGMIQYLGMRVIHIFPLQALLHLQFFAVAVMSLHYKRLKCGYFYLKLF